jgi:putative colanic acid biosynthesis acetyltransferase WcaF
MIPTPTSRGSSPWTLLHRMRLFLWAVSWTLLCRWTPKPMNSFRVAVLRVFGATISPGAFIHQRARIAHPWNLTMGVGACLGDRAHAYSLALIDIQAGATVAQEAYLCTGSHDFNQPAYPLTVSPIVIEPDAFIGARAFVLPGVTIGRGAIVGACSVVTRSVAPHATVAGNPARLLY